MFFLFLLALPAFILIIPNVVAIIVWLLFCYLYYYKLPVNTQEKLCVPLMFLMIIILGVLS